jgi:hypothetical protein
VSDPTADNEFVVEIDLGEMDWSTPAAWEDSPAALQAAPLPEPEPEPAAQEDEAALEILNALEALGPHVVEPDGARAAEPDDGPRAVEAFEPSERAASKRPEPTPPSPPAPPARPAPRAVAPHEPKAVTPRAPEAVTPRAPEAVTPRAERGAEVTARRGAEVTARRALMVAGPRAPEVVAYPALPPAFAGIVALINPASARVLAGSTFARLLRALDTLGVIEKALTRPKAVSLGPLFEDVRTQAVALLSQVTEAVSTGGVTLERRHREAFDGMRFVIGHELTKVFRQEFPRLVGDESPAYSRADLSRAWGLLHNCLQQTAIALAQALAPGASGEALFEDYRLRIENSFALYRELNVLLRKVTAAEGCSGILLKHSLVRHLEHFREETMRLLMYRDWGEFGRYADDVKRAFEEMEEFEPVLHEFSQYLRTLIHHVGMRQALRAVPPQGYEGQTD